MSAGYALRGSFPVASLRVTLVVAAVKDLDVVLVVVHERLLSRVHRVRLLLLLRRRRRPVDLIPQDAQVVGGDSRVDDSLALLLAAELPAADASRRRFAVGLRRRRSDVYRLGRRSVEYQLPLLQNTCGRKEQRTASVHKELRQKIMFKSSENSEISI